MHIFFNFTDIPIRRGNSSNTVRFSIHQELLTSTLNGLLLMGFSFKQNDVTDLTLVPPAMGCIKEKIDHWNSVSWTDKE